MIVKKSVLNNFRAVSFSFVVHENYLFFFRKAIFSEQATSNRFCPKLTHLTDSSDLFLKGSWHYNVNCLVDHHDKTLECQK